MKQTVFNAFAAYPFVMDFDLIVDFDPFFALTVPSVVDVLNVMVATPFYYQDYIEYTVWKGKIGDIFFHVDSVMFFSEYKLG